MSERALHDPRHPKAKRHSNPVRTPRVLVFVDESNVVSSVRALGRKLDWLKLRDHLVGADRGRELIEMVIYAGLPPPIPEWQTERDKKNKFLHWLRSNGFLVVAVPWGDQAEGFGCQSCRGHADRPPRSVRDLGRRTP